MNAQVIFKAAKVSSRLDSLVGCFERTETAAGEPLSEKTLKFNASVAEALKDASAIIEELLSQQQ